MKPKTKLQHEVLLNSKQLPNINTRMVEWAKDVCLSHIGYATKSRVICMECGERFSTDIVQNKHATCPHCNQKLTIEKSRKIIFEQKTYVAKAIVFGDFQVIRNFVIESYHKAGMKSIYSGYEILQHWYLNDKKREVVALNHTVNWYCDSWNGEMEIRDKNKKRYYDVRNRYDVYPEKYHPNSVFKKEYSIYGINHKLKNLTFIEAMNIIPSSSYAETLLKAKQYAFLACFIKGEHYQVTKYWSSVKICIRNKYSPIDIGMWFDYLDLLSFFNKDLYNAHYVCPRCLKKEHDRFLNKKVEIDRKRKLEEKKKKIQQDQIEYEKRKNPFFGITFKDKKITIKVLETVQEFLEEGDILKHCLFENEYYKKDNSLILSARIDSKPIETIELSLSTLEILQSRGQYNKPTEYHERIIGIINRNINKIQNRLNQCVLT